MKSKLIPLVAAAVVFPSAVFGLGIRVVDQDAEATARGDAFTATADNPSAIYYNPAGITQLQGQNVLAGAYGIYLQSKYTGDGTTVRTKDQPQAVPQLYYTNTFPKVPITLGFGIYAPYGFGLEYPDDTPFRQLALKGSVTFITFNPVLAWKVSNTFSIAAGVNVNYANADLDRGVLPTPGNNFEFKGDGNGVGFNFGAMWQPAPQHSFGISYHSASTIDLSGHSTLSVPGVEFGRTAASTYFTFPQYIEAGYSFRPTPEWNFEADIDWTNWQELKTLTLQQQGTAPLSIPFNWDNSFMYEFGATRYLSDGYRVSAGYIYSQSSISGGNFNPLVPDSNRNIFSVGIGQTKGRYSWDFAYQFAYGPDRSVYNTQVLDNGTYRFISHAIELSFGYHF